MTEETTAMLTKKGLRASLLARRKQLFESLALDNGLAERFLEMLELARPKSVGLFWPIRSEPGLLSVARDWLKRTGGLIYLPETRPDCMIYRLWHEGAELRKDCAGIPYPQGEEASKPPAMVVAPCVMRSRAGGSGMAEAISTGIWPPTAISVHWRLELPLMSFGCPKRSSSHLTSRLMQL